MLKNPLVGLCALLAAVAAERAPAFSFEDVSRQAQRLAEKSYKAPDAKLPEKLREITYDDYRDIRFRPDRSLWRGTRLPFEVQFFHPGFLFQHWVKINLLTAEGVKPYPFDPDSFNYGRVQVEPKALKKLGYAGFRIHYPLNRPDYKDEVAVFLGASYVRAVGHKQVYGLSGRGLAVDTGLASGEEFPAFTEFWIEWPAPEAKEIVVYALLDSRSLTGAYRFLIRPGVSTTMEVRARLFLRRPVGKLGIAPLTSMYFFGENQPSPVEDYRPEVHDSGGLSVAAGNGEWIWRPLVNPRRLLVTSFATKQPHGFGLMQRDRAFHHYEDLESRFELRPSAWVEPLGNWGSGRIELVQIPTANEFNDNIVAYWVPDHMPEPGQPVEVQYRVWWQMAEETAPPTSRVMQTRRGLTGAENEVVRFVVDFEGPALTRLPPDAKVDPVASIDEHGELLDVRAYRNEATGGWRLVLELRRKDDAQPVEIRAFLRGADGPLSETWAYVLPLP